MVEGAGAMVAGQTVAKPSMDPIVETCTDAAKFAKSDLHAYEPWLGGPFVCIITNFLVRPLSWSACILLLLGSDKGVLGQLELTKTPEVILCCTARAHDARN